MRYKLVLNIRHVGDVVDGEFVTHLKETQNLWDYVEKWKANPVTMGDHEEPMDWNDEIKVWYKLMGDLQRDTVLRAIPKDPPPPGLPDDAPHARDAGNATAA
jgi:hypothetical protein